MRRILYFSRDYTTHDHRFLTKLAQTGDAIYYLRLEQRDQVLESRALPPEVQVIAWVGGQKPTRLTHAYRLYRDLKRIIREINPHLIQAGPIQTCAFLVALTGFQPLVSTSWGYDLLIDAPKSPLLRAITRFTLRKSAAFVGDCNTIRQLATQHGMPDQRIVTFPWGVDLDHFSPPSPASHQPAKQHPFTLLSTRNWEPIYGITAIARAFVIAVHQRPDMRLVMLGNGSQANVLRTIFTDGGVMDQVDFPGHIDQTNLPHYYHQAEVYISASHSDGTSISLLESLACACPVIVSDIPGNREWVTPGVQGWLFPPDDHLTLSELMIQAYDSRNELAGMGKAARQTAEARANWNLNFPHLLQAYSIALTHANT